MPGTPELSEPSDPICRHPPEQIASLSRRELDVFRLMPSGASNRQLARRLFVTERTVRAHLCSISRKLGGASRLQIALAAYAQTQVRTPVAGRSPARDTGPRRYHSPRLTSGCTEAGRTGCG